MGRFKNDKRSSTAIKEVPPSSEHRQRPRMSLSHASAEGQEQYEALIQAVRAQSAALPPRRYPPKVTKARASDKGKGKAKAKAPTPSPSPDPIDTEQGDADVVSQPAKEDEEGETELDPQEDEDEPELELQEDPSDNEGIAYSDSGDEGGDDKRTPAEWRKMMKKVFRKGYRLGLSKRESTPLMTINGPRPPNGAGPSNWQQSARQHSPQATLGNIPRDKIYGPKVKMIKKLLDGMPGNKLKLKTPADQYCRRCLEGGWPCVVSQNPFSRKKGCYTCGTNYCSFVNSKG